MHNKPTRERVKQIEIILILSFHYVLLAVCGSQFLSLSLYVNAIKINFREQQFYFCLHCRNIFMHKIAPQHTKLHTLTGMLLLLLLLLIVYVLKLGECKYKKKMCEWEGREKEAESEKKQEKIYCNQLTFDETEFASIHTHTA